MVRKGSPARLYLRESPDGWCHCDGAPYEYQRIVVNDASGTQHGNHEIDRR